jgi:hypothetical protein
MESAEIQGLNGDYIRLTERFKALWTFHQFLLGIHQAFLADAPPFQVNFDAIYERLRGVSARVAAGDSSNTVREQLDLAETELALAGRNLRLSDRALSPSFIRRFFNKLRTSDEKIVFNLLRFYFSQPELDEDVADKIDFLATLAAGVPGTEGPQPRDLSESVRIFEKVVSQCPWPLTGSDEVNALVAAINEIAGEVSGAKSFEQLAEGRYIERVRQIKHRLGFALANSQVLASVGVCNVKTKAAFRRLFREERARLEEAGERIENLEREVSRSGGRELPDEFRRFRTSKKEFALREEESNVRTGDILALKSSIADVLGKFDLGQMDVEEIDDALEIAEELPSEDATPSHISESLQMVLASVEMGEGSHRQIAHLGLEPWEIRAAKRAIAAGGTVESNRDALFLEAAALRIRAEEESSRWAQSKKMGMPLPGLGREVKETLSLAAETDRRFSGLIREAGDDSLPEEIAALVRSRFRLLKAYSTLWLLHDEDRQ